MILQGENFDEIFKFLAKNLTGVMGEFLLRSIPKDCEH